jgi:hypothetical protein
MFLHEPTLTKGSFKGSVASLHQSDVDCAQLTHAVALAQHVLDVHVSSSSVVSGVDLDVNALPLSSLATLVPTYGTESVLEKIRQLLQSGKCLRDLRQFVSTGNCDGIIELLNDVENYSLVADCTREVLTCFLFVVVVLPFSTCGTHTHHMQ